MGTDAVQRSPNLRKVFIAPLALGLKSCAPPPRFSAGLDGTGRGRADSEFNQNKAIGVNRSSGKRFSIASRGFESRPGHCKSPRLQRILAQNCACVPSVPLLLSESP